MKRYFILVAFLILVAIFFAVGTLGLFETNANMSVSTNLAAWSIKINNLSTENLNTSFNVTNFVVTTNDNVAANVFAPGSTAYFDIDLNVSDTQVSVMYDVTFDFSNITNKAIVISDIVETNNNQFYQTNSSTFSGIIPLSDIASNSSRVFRVYLAWNDDPLNGENDYLIGSATDRTLIIPVTIHAIQYENADQNHWIEQKLTHIVAAATSYAEDYYEDSELTSDTQNITVNDLITPVNYLKTVEKNNNQLTYYNNVNSSELKTLTLTITLDDGDVSACIMTDATNQTLLDEESDFSTYSDLNLYCE